MLDLFAQYLWPGNVRQLRNEIQRAVALSLPATAVTAEHLSPELTRSMASRGSAVRGRPLPATTPPRRSNGLNAT